MQQDDEVDLTSEYSVLRTGYKMHNPARFGGLLGVAVMHKRRDPIAWRILGTLSASADNRKENLTRLTRSH